MKIFYTLDGKRQRSSMRNGIAARMSRSSRKINPTQKQFSLNRGASKKQSPISLKVFHAFLLAAITLSITVTSTIAQQGKDTGYGFCPLHKISYKAANCPKCLTGGGTGSGETPSRPRRDDDQSGNISSGPSQAEIAAQQAEDERKRVERQAAEQRAIAEAKEQQRRAQFLRDKTNALVSLKGVGGASSGLKSAGNVQHYSSDSSDVGLKGLGDNKIKNVQQDRAVRDLGGTDAAWKQLNAAAYLAGLSLKNSSDPVESAYLAEQSARAMNGDPLGVVVPAAAARPHAERSAASITAYQEVTKQIMGELKTRTAELAEKKKKVVESNQKKETAKKETQAAREQVEKLELESKQPKLPEVAATPPPEADKAKDDALAKAKDDALAKAKDDALAKAKAALLAAQQSEAEITRAEERSVSEAKFSEQKINSTLVGLNDLNANPDLAESMLAKLQPAPSTTPATTPAP